MEKKPIGPVAVILSVLACVASGVALFRNSHAPSVSDALPDPIAIQVRELDGQLAQLRSDMARLEANYHESGSTRSSEVPAVAARPAPEIEARLAALELQYATIQKQLKDRAISGALEAQSLAAVKPTEPKEAQRIAMDVRASEKDRLAAFSALRNKKVDGEDARSHDVILAMLDIAEHSDDENSRLDVYRNLHGANDPAARDSMLRALAGDPSARVRQKVAQDIDTFLADPLVQRGLRSAADTDTDAGVRGQALMTLSAKH